MFRGSLCSVRAGADFLGSFYGRRSAPDTLYTQFRGYSTDAASAFAHRKWLRGNGVPSGELSLHILIAGLGRGTGTDFSCEVFEGRTKVFEMDFGRQMNCQVRSTFHSFYTVVAGRHVPGLMFALVRWFCWFVPCASSIQQLKLNLAC